MTNVDENRVKGNYGVYSLMKELSRFSLVRPVFEGTDLGIDLYCETFETPVKGGRPFLHFWVQVKTTTSDTLKDGRMSYSFDSEHLKYWFRQPVPVFAFIIRIQDWPETGRTYPFYIIDIKSHLLEQTEIIGRGSHNLHSNITINSKEELGKFIFEYIPYITAFHKMPEGIIPSICTIDPKYEIKVITKNSYKYLDDFLWQIRKTSAFAIIGSFEQARANESIKSSIMKLEQISGVFRYDDHWETPHSLGLAAFLREDYEAAKDQFARALSLIEADPNTNGIDSWQSIKKSLKERIEMCEGHEHN